MRSTFNIYIDNGIKCLIFAHNDVNLRLDYEYLMSVLNFALYHNKTKYANIDLLKKLLLSDHATRFINTYIGAHMKYILNKNDLTFDHLATDKRVKLYKYIKIEKLKDKLIYRYWLMCQMDILKDNRYDIHGYSKLL